jgi:WD40 repeat protein
MLVDNSSSGLVYADLPRSFAAGWESTWERHYPARSDYELLAFQLGFGGIAGLSGDREIKFWDFKTLIQLATIEVEMIVADLAFSPDGRTLVWGGGDGRVEFLQLAPEPVITGNERQHAGD